MLAFRQHKSFFFKDSRGRELVVHYFFYQYLSDSDLALSSVLYKGRNVIRLLRDKTIDRLSFYAEQGVFSVECDKDGPNF